MQFKKSTYILELQAKQSCLTINRSVLTLWSMSLATLSFTKMFGALPGICDPLKGKQCMEKFAFSPIASYCHNWNIFWLISIPDWHPLFGNNKIAEVFWNRMGIRISAQLLTKERGHAKLSTYCSSLASAQCVVRSAVSLAWATFLSWRAAIKPLFNTISGEDLVTVFSSSGSMLPFFFSVVLSLLIKHTRTQILRDMPCYIAPGCIYYFFIPELYSHLG